VATSSPLRVIQLVVMLSSPWSLRITAIRVPRPVVVGGRKEFCSRAIPGPGPSQNSALSGTPAPKVQGTYPVRDVPAFSLAFNVGEAQASCRLPQLRCWVAPSSKAVCPARPATPLLLPPLLGKPTACSTWPLFLSNFAGASPSKMLRASRSGRSGRWRRHCRFVRWPNRQRLRRWEPFVQGLRPIAFILRISLVTGRAGPGPGGRLPSHFSGGLCRRPGA